MEKQTRTIGEVIEKKISEYKEIYKILKEVGNKNPARNTLSEAWINETFVAQRVTERLKELYGEEAEKEKANESKKLKLKERIGEK